LSNNIEIKPVNTKSDLMKFIKLPWKIYEDDPNWVPHLIMERKKFFDKNKNPFFKNNPTQFYLAYRNGELVGRIGAILNKQHNEFHKDKTGFFGFLECVDDIEISKALLDTAKIWLKERGCDLIMGPMNPSTNDECGFLVKGFDKPPYFMMTHTKKYYIDHMEKQGFEKAKDLLAYEISYDNLSHNPKLERVAKIIQKKYPVTIRKVNMKRFNEELELVREVYNDAWSRNWGFVPMTREEFNFVANDFKQIIDPNVVFIGEFKGEPIGFMLALPDYNQVFIKIRNGRLFPTGIFKFLYYKSKINRLRVITLGIKQKYQPLGLGALFYQAIIENAKPNGYYGAEMSWVLEDNELMVKAAELLGGYVHKVYRIYQAPL
jgi:GNAT superfamily N-acetyltransferase